MTRVVAGLVVLVSIAGIAFNVAYIEYIGTFAILPLALSPFALVGAVLVVRVPRNVVGWLLCGSGVIFALTFAGGEYAWLALVERLADLPGAEIVGAYSGVGFLPAVGLAVLMLLFFPTGRGLGGRWSWVERALIVFTVLATLDQVFEDSPVQIAGSTVLALTKPFALHGPVGAFLSWIKPLFGPTTLPLVLLAPASLFIRYRRSSAVEREQIKWLGFSGLLALTLLVFGNVLPADLGGWLFPVAVASLGTLPIAIGIAILRYRLYDIDVLIRRTVIYGATTLTLAALFFGLVLAIQALLRPFTQGNELAIAASTLGSVALFQPLRRRVQGVVDRRFYRSGYDAARTVDDFSARLRDQVDLDAVQADLLRTAREAMQSAHASIWLRR